jgi:hypothetical protein
MKKKVTEKEFFEFVPKYEALVGSMFGADAAYKQAYYLGVIEWAKKDPKQYVFNYDAIPIIWFAQDKNFCRLFCAITPRAEHKRAIALMPYDKNEICAAIEKDPKAVERIPYDLYFDFEWLAHVAVRIDPRALTCTPKKAHLDPALRAAIDKQLELLNDDIRARWVLYLMPNNPMPLEAGKEFKGKNSMAQALKRMLAAPSYRERIVSHPKALSQLI